MAEITCTNCGKRLKESDKECPRCHNNPNYNNGRYVKKKQREVTKRLSKTETERTCKTCKWWAGKWCRCPLMTKYSFQFRKPFIVEKDFGCNQWEAHDD